MCPVLLVRKANLMNRIEAIEEEGEGGTPLRFNTPQDHLTQNTLPSPPPPFIPLHPIHLPFTQSLPYLK